MLVYRIQMREWNFDTDWTEIDYNYPTYGKALSAIRNSNPKNSKTFEYRIVPKVIFEGPIIKAVERT